MMIGAACFKFTQTANQTQNTHQNNKLPCLNVSICTRENLAGNLKAAQFFPYISKCNDKLGACNKYHTKQLFDKNIFL